MSLVVAWAVSCRNFDEVVVVLPSIEAVEVEGEEEVAVVVVEAVLLLWAHRDWNLNNDYFVLIGNSIHLPNEAK